MPRNKLRHEFDGAVTVNEFRKAISSEWLDTQNIPKGTPFYIMRDGKPHSPGSLVIDEESGSVYLDLGDEVE